MERNELIEKAKKVFFYEQVSIDGFCKEALILGCRKDIGRVFALKINESEKFPWRVSTQRLEAFSNRIIELTKDATTIANSLNQNTVNKEEIAAQYAKVLKQKGRHALPLFLEHFFPDMFQNTFDMLLLNGFKKEEAESVMEEIDDFQFEILLAQRPEGAVYLVEVLPIFKGMHADAIWGSRIILPVSVSFQVPGTENLNAPARNFLQMKMIGFAERFSEMPHASNPQEGMLNDKKVIEEWDSSREMWYIQKEQWILNFLSHLATAYITAKGIRDSKSVVVIGDHSHDKTGMNASIMNMN